LIDNVGGPTEPDVYQPVRDRVVTAWLRDLTERLAHAESAVLSLEPKGN